MQLLFKLCYMLRRCFRAAPPNQTPHGLNEDLRRRELSVTSKSDVRFQLAAKPRPLALPVAPADTPGGSLAPDTRLRISAFCLI